MKLTWIASAAMALGVSALLPAWASAHDRWDYRYDRRYDYRYYGGNVDTDIPLGDVPGQVLRTADIERRGRPIEAVQFVNRNGHVFYRFRIDNRRGGDFNIRVSPNGALLGIEPAGPEYGYDWRRY